MTETRLTEPPVAGNEVDTLVGELERVRRTFAWKAGGLDAAGLGWDRFAGYGFSRLLAANHQLWADLFGV